MTPRTAVRQAPLSSAISQSLLRFLCVDSVLLSVCGWLPGGPQWPWPFHIHIFVRSLYLQCWLQSLTSQDGASLPCLGYKQTLTSLSGSPSPPFRIISLWEKSATMQRQPCGQGAGDHQQPDMQSWSWVLLELNPERLQALPTPD